ncbi:O-methyltransferase [Bacillaceae bacterium Marseille-Q3522]|nr:O-methyltransferase [Bacillaceae bacterium Marseille-Q3522]
MLSEKLNEYIDALIPPRDAFFREMEQYAKDHHIPIMELSGMEAVLQILKIQQPKKILEIGTAIGYSALRMAAVLPKTMIVTIERDSGRLQLAKQYVMRAGKQEQIMLMSGDALNMGQVISALGPFEAIFIDAAKGQYRRFFETFEPYLAEKGLFLIDNVLFRGLVAEQDQAEKRLRNLVRKINSFNEWLMSQSNYETVILPVGDGVAISKKR